MGSQGEQALAGLEKCRPQRPKPGNAYRRAALRGARRLGKMLEMNLTRADTVLGNARIILADRVVERGWIAFADSSIAELGRGDVPGGGVWREGRRVA
jgi:hypothetical protein